MQDGIEGNADRQESLFELLSRKVAGQPAALHRIVPYLDMYRARLNPPDRPAGVFLLLGPSGTGKTRTVEALAEVLHGSPRQLLKVDCAEYQSDHEVAKLIGAPPGYIGHRETKPLLTQERLIASVSARSDLAIVLFDEIEKAAPSLSALLLGVLDRGTLRLGDNTPVNFENTFVFLTSNLGAREMLKAVHPAIGFQGVERRSPESIAERLQGIGLGAVRRRFSPEFVNRIDAVITYRPLDRAALDEILDQHISELQQHVRTRLGERAFDLVVSPAARELLLGTGTSEEHGARELRRTIHRLLTQPLASQVADGRIPPGAIVDVDFDAEGATLRLRPSPGAARHTTREVSRPAVLAVDDNVELLKWLEQALAGAGMVVTTANSVQGARNAAASQRFDLLVVDLVLADADGLSVAVELLQASPRIQVIVTTGSELSPDESARCERHGFAVLRKPFLPEAILDMVRARLVRSSSAGG
ncbi:MAG TPA: AAA family ATPase [Vicinamibacterales bacterium]|nr:AAA family ATPase [Vicinamibacterales bacterium]